MASSVEAIADLAPVTEVEGGLFLHATAIAYAATGVLVLGPSGSGKSSLALALLNGGARLVADDGVLVRTAGEAVTLLRPDTATDMIEMRGLGLLHAGPVVPSVPLALVVDLAREEDQRLPPRRMAAIGAVQVPLIRGAGRPDLAQGLLHMLRFGRAVP